MSGNVLARIRAACAEVARRAQQVRIDAERLEAFAAELERTPSPASHLDPAHHPLGEGETALAYVLVLDAVNFGSGYFPKLDKRDGMSGYFTVATSLAEHFEKHGPWSAEQLAALRARDCAEVLRQDLAVPDVAELMGLFAGALNELGRFVHERYAGSFSALVDEAEHSAARLVQVLSALPAYRDVARYDGLEVPFFKRAQLTAADLSTAFRGCGWGRFEDLDELTLFADNLVPHVLRQERVLVYAPELAARIDRGELIAAGSPEEVEIRAGAVHAVECCVAAIRRAGGETSARELDSVLWTRGQRPAVKARPRHRTRTTYY